ncbi:MAG TPA: lysylphosphatidylglycerol synthase transmembrane domain-containing protein [Candidatus Hydrogenedentes bacterium]|nr:lysylphosphatidylglycerol synthase transmembrane domain-containing protein [Candidatus Hydrogenedentota bacterium]HOM47389.1 lysylphosphatidylglycerol synthase transmembrane domain-containing protein [Candidatus Hydrogenedentota bacterium]HOR50777.1 lysylphosphatidylglycerol synthase transmembrane domain-containing protein [Candidatus Hydrogenedentota bacterium]HPK24639.1 lysylphosphatidylglycerol synthase transmembrane domain-containing protein [Candidatus Hydrogenedentota bacterium]
MQENESAPQAEEQHRSFRYWADKLRTAVLCLIAGITLYALYSLRGSDWGAVYAFWHARRFLLAQVFLLGCCDIFLDGLIWRQVLRHQGVTPGKVQSIFLYFSAHAALLMPAQLGRAFRSAETARRCYVSAATTFSAEVLYLGFTAISASALFVSAFMFFQISAIAFFLPLLLIPAGLVAAQIIRPLLIRLKLQIGFVSFLQPALAGLVFLSMLNWLINALNLYLVFRELIPDLSYMHALMISTSTLFVGAISGIPGGFGVAESYIGALLYWLKAPPVHLVPAVLAFRILSVWIWVPVGWLTLGLQSVAFRKKSTEETEASQ